MDTYGRSLSFTNLWNHEVTVLLYMSVTFCHNKTSYGFYYTIGSLFVSVRFWVGWFRYGGKAFSFM